MIWFLEHGLAAGSGVMILSAFAGSMVSMGFVLAVSGRVKQMSLLVICGIMIGYICSAVTDFVVTFADDSNIVNLHNWSMGSFSGISWDNVRVMAVVTAVTMVFGVSAWQSPWGRISSVKSMQKTWASISGGSGQS